MGMAAKVLWGEGLFLRPRHFQRQDQYHEMRLHHPASALHPYLWGVAHMEWDLAALKTGTLRLQALSAIFRDGEVFDAMGDGAPGGDALPPPVDLEALPPSLQEVAYCAALPVLNREGANYTAQPATGAGAASTPPNTRDVHSLRAYDHAQPGACFDAIDGIIRELLDTVISSKYFSIALLVDKPSYYLGKLDSDKTDQHTTLYLAIRAAMPAIELVDMVPLRVKVGAPDDVEKCVLSAMPGVKLSHAPQVPAAIPVRPDTCYFAIENRGVLYDLMRKAQSISVYVPAGIRDLQLELIAVTA